MASGFELRFVGCVLASVVIGSVGIACGSQPATSFADTVPSEAGTVPPHDSGTSESGGGGGAGLLIVTCWSTGDAGLRPLSECSCTFSVAKAAFALQCGEALCSLLNEERADCSLDGTLSVTPDAGPGCAGGGAMPTDTDGGAAPEGGLRQSIPCQRR